MKRADMIPASLDDDEAWLAYADWLQSQGEPHGELIAIDMGIERGRTELAVARNELLAKYGHAILGETIAKFIASGYPKVTWQRGHIVDFEYAARARTTHQMVVGWLLKEIVEHFEPFRFVQRFAFPATDVSDLTVFEKFPHLETLDVEGSNVRKPDLQKMGTARPNVKVNV